MPTPRYRLCHLFLPCLMWWCGTACAATVIDIDPDGATPVTVPTVIASDDSPVYITNGNTATAASKQIDTLRVGERAALHLGYDRTSVAGAVMNLGVTGNMAVEGAVRMGKDAGGGTWLPGAATTSGIGLNVGERLAVTRGGSVVADGASDDGLSAITAKTVLLDGGSLWLDDYATLKTTSTASEASVVIRNGGSLTVNSGLPPRTAHGVTDSTQTWAFKGVNASGGGILVDSGGILAAGSSGGVIDGASGSEKITVRSGGILDAGKGALLVRNMGDVAVDGSYRAGYVGGSVTQLTHEGGRVVFGKDANIAVSRDLARYLNTGGSSVWQGAEIARGRDIVFTGGGVPLVKSGMGFYTLDTTTYIDDGTGTDKSITALRVDKVERAVLGDRSSSDRELFRDNMEDVWSGSMNREQSDNIYNLSVAEYPTIEARGEAGELNKAVLDALVDGRGQSVDGRGAADQGLFEMYNGGMQWGVNNVAYNTAGLFMAGLDRRVERLGAEMDRLGHEVVSGSALASCPVPDLYDGRFWGGGFGAKDSADLDYGIAGYTYRPRGLMLGYDKRWRSLSLGLAGAYGKGDYEDRAATGNDSEIQSYSGGLYAAYHGETGFNASAFATLSYLDNDLADQRGGMRRTADYSSYAWAVGGRLGYDMCLTDKMLIQPSVGVTRVQAVSKSHDEFLDGTGVMRVGDVRRDSTLVPLEITLGYDVYRSFGALLRLNGTLGYAYDFDDNGLDGRFGYTDLIGSTSMQVAQREAGKHRWNLGAGVVFTGRKFDFGARYDYFKRSEQETHQAKGSVGVKF